MDERVERAHRLEVLVERLGLKGQDEICKRIPGRDGGLHRSTWNRWLSSKGSAVPTRDHLFGLVDNCIEQDRLRREDRPRWLEVVEGILQPGRVDRSTWERSVEDAGSVLPPSGPVVVCNAATLRDLEGENGFGPEAREVFTRRTVDQLRAACGLSTVGAYAVIKKLLGANWEFGLAVLQWRLGESGKVSFCPGEDRFELLFGTGERSSFHMVGDVAGPSFNGEEA